MMIENARGARILNARHLIRLINGALASYATDDIHDDPQRNVWKE
jgi:hypothetical protein